MTKEERIQKAVNFFKEGYNCSQSVVAAYADLYGFTHEQALHMAASFGGGIGRMRETCGAACGMFLLAGLERCALEGADRGAKAANYALVQELADKFRKETGALRCADLLGLSKRNPLFLLQKHALLSIMRNVLASGWWKQQLAYLVSFWKMKVRFKKYPTKEKNS